MALVLIIDEEGPKSLGRRLVARLGYALQRLGHRLVTWSQRAALLERDTESQ